MSDTVQNIKNSLRADAVLFPSLHGRVILYITLTLAFVILLVSLYITVVCGFLPWYVLLLLVGLCLYTCVVAVWISRATRYIVTKELTKEDQL